MNRRDLLAYALIGLGVLALLARLSDGAGWIWIALVAGALLAAYGQQRTYGFLVLGGTLAGTAAGLLLQQAFPRWDGIFLVALGVGLIVVDRVEPREPRWARGVGLGLAGLGLVLALLNAGVLRSAWFALLLIAVGALMLWRRHEDAAFPPPLVTPIRPEPARPPPSAEAAPEPAAEARTEPDAGVAPAAPEPSPADPHDASDASTEHAATDPRSGTG
jgi:hypothetical protein